MSKGTQASRIYSDLKQSIMDGRLLPGDPLLEADLSSTYEVSRTPIREAIRRLHQEQLVELTSFVGARVARVSPTDVLEAFDARIWIEPPVFAVAATDASDDLILALTSVMAHMPKHSRTRADALAAMEADFDFHRTVFKAVGNRFAVELLETGLSVTRRAINLSPPPRFTQAQTEHEAILEAFASRDSIGAADRVREHLVNARTRYSGGYLY